MLAPSLSIAMALAIELTSPERTPAAPVVAPDLSAAALVYGDDRFRIDRAETVAFSPDGTRVAVAWNDIRVFDRATGKPVFVAPLRAHRVAWTGPEQLRAGLSEGGLVEVDLGAGTTRRVTSTDHREGLEVHVAWGSAALSLDDDGEATLWNGDRVGSPGRAAIHPLDGGLWGSAWAGPGGFVYRQQDTAYTWIAPDGEPVTELRGSPVAAAVGADHVLWVEEVAHSQYAVLHRVGRDGQELEAFRLPVGRFLYAALSADGARLAVWSYQEGLRIWDVEARRRISAGFPLAGHSQPRSLAFSPDGAWLALTAEPDLIVVDVETGEVPVHVGRWTEPDVLAVDEVVAFSDGDDRTLVVGTDGPRAPLLRGADDLAVFGERVYAVDHHATLAWDAADGRELWRDVLEQDLPCDPLAVSPSGDRVAHTHGYREVVVHDATDGAVLSAWPIGDGSYDHEVWGLVFDDTGDRIVTVSSGESFRRNLLTVWDAASGDALHQLVAYSYDVLGLAEERWAYDGHHGMFEGPVGERGEQREGVNGVSQSSDGRVRLLRVPDPETSQDRTTLEVDGRSRVLWPTSVRGAVSPSGERVALALGDGRIAMWNVADLRKNRRGRAQVVPLTEAPGGVIPSTPSRWVAAWAPQGNDLVPRGEDAPSVDIAPDDDGPWSVEGSVLRRGAEEWLLPGRHANGVRAIDDDHVWLWVDKPYTEIVDVGTGTVVARLQGASGYLQVDGDVLRNGDATWRWPDLTPLSPGPRHIGLAAIAQSGDLRVTSDSDGQLMIWRGGRLERTLWGFAEHLSGASVVGERIVVSGRARHDGAVWVIDGPEGEPTLLETFDGFLDVALSPDGGTVVVAVDDESRSRVEGWDVATRERRWSASGAFDTLSFATHGRFFVASGYEQERVVVFDTATGKRHREHRLPDGFEHSAVDIAGDRVLLGHSTHEETLDRLWVPGRSDVEVDTDGQLRAVGGGGRLVAESWNNDGDTILTVLDADGRSLWSAPTEGVAAAAWDGDTLLVGGYDDVMQAFQVPAARAPEPTVLGDLSGLALTDPPPSLSPAPTGDDTFPSTEATDGGALAERLARHWMEVEDVSRAGSRLAVAGGGVVLLDDGRILDGTPGFPQRVALSPSGRRVAVLDDRGEAWVWDRDAGPVGRVRLSLRRDADLEWADEGTLVTRDEEGVRRWTVP